MGMSNLSPSSCVTESLSWDLSFFNHYPTEDEESEVLTGLVRTSYLNYLRKSLITNYEHWLENNRESDDFDCSSEDILKCANFLEHQALRACMIASYYQRAMVKTMKEIKKSTEEGSLFSPLIEQVFDNKIKKCFDKGTQTNISLTNCKIASPDSSQQSFPNKQSKDTSTIDITLENSNVIIINPCATDKCEKDIGNDDLEDLFNILMTSPNFSEQNDLDSPNSKKRKYDETERENGNIFLTNIAEENDLESQTHLSYLEPKHTINLDERLEKFAALFGEDGSNSNSKGLDKTAEETDYKITTPANEVSFNSYENNFIDQEESSPFKLALDWKTEFAAQLCNLKCILARLSPCQRKKVKKKFFELFGVEKSICTEISLTEAALSRKRTANLVVGALTPHYLAGKIASRTLFKSLAKKITDDILIVTNVAELEEVTDKVNIYFENGRCIYSEKDINNA